jgi:hypothetical protein
MLVEYHFSLCVCVCCRGLLNTYTLERTCEEDAAEEAYLFIFTSSEEKKTYLTSFSNVLKKISVRTHNSADIYKRPSPFPLYSLLSLYSPFFWQIHTHTHTQISTSTLRTFSHCCLVRRCVIARVRSIRLGWEW